MSDRKVSSVKLLFNVTRREFPVIWPVAFLWQLIMLLLWRGIINPALWAIDCGWRWLGRGRVEWEHWSPRVGDRVSTCSAGVATVLQVNLWHDEVLTDDGHIDSLRNCCEPVSREEATDR
jgi:hypothetical protein